MFQKIMDILFGPKGRSKVAAGKSILIIDDGPLERKVTSEILLKRGFKTVTAENGEAGLRAAIEQKPDLILLHFLMPGMSGKEVCQRLKQSKDTKDIPVIFLTGSVKPTSVIDCYEAGAEYYLSKPVNARTLINQVEMIFAELHQPPSE